MRQLLALLFGLAFLVASPLAARELVVDLSEPVVRVTTGFTGSKLLLYGHAAGPGDVIVVVRGPQADKTVRKKERIVGIWANRGAMTFNAVPGFYTISSNKPIAEILGGEQRAYHQIGTDYLPLAAEEESLDPGPSRREVIAYREALIRNMERDGLFSTQTGNLLFLGNGLFRTRIAFPANVPIGTYGIDVYLVRDNEVVAFETTLLSVRKFGLEAEIYDLAQRHSLAYGVLAILIAAGAGWIASAAFRKS